MPLVDLLAYPLRPVVWDGERLDFVFECHNADSTSKTCKIRKINYSKLAQAKLKKVALKCLSLMTKAPNGNPKRSGLGWDSPDQPLGAPSVPPALVERRPPPPSQEGGKPSPGEGTAGSHAGVRFIVECDSRIKPNRGGGYPPPPVLGCSCTPPV